MKERWRLVRFTALISSQVSPPPPQLPPTNGPPSAKWPTTRPWKRRSPTRSLSGKKREFNKISAKRARSYLFCRSSRGLKYTISKASQTTTTVLRSLALRFRDRPISTLPSPVLGRSWSRHRSRTETHSYQTWAGTSHVTRGRVTFSSGITAGTWILKIMRTKSSTRKKAGPNNPCRVRRYRWPAPIKVPVNYRW